MRTTKNLILALLKRTGGNTVSELTQALGLASMTVRQHLIALERDALIQAREVRNGNGRPHYLYSLTAKADETFPKRYDWLATSLLEEVAFLQPEEIAGLPPDARQQLLLRKLGARMANQYADQVNGRPLEELVVFVTEVLQEESGFAEWKKNDRGYEIRACNCPYSKVSEINHHLCEWHMQFLSELLDRPVKSDHRLSNGGNCCQFLVEL